MIFGRITSCSGSSALLVGPASACRSSSGYRQSLIVTRKGSLRTRFRCAACSGVCSVVEASVSAGKRGCRACVNLAKLLTGRSDSRGLGPLARRRATPVPLPANESSTSPPGRAARDDAPPRQLQRHHGRVPVTRRRGRDRPHAAGGRARRTAQPAPPGHGGRASRGASSRTTSYRVGGGRVRHRVGPCTTITLPSDQPGAIPSRAASAAGLPLAATSVVRTLAGSTGARSRRAERAADGRAFTVPEYRSATFIPAHAARPEHSGDLIDG